MATSCQVAWADVEAIRDKPVHLRRLSTILHSLARAVLLWVLTLTRPLLAAPAVRPLASALQTTPQVIRQATDLPVQLCAACQSHISCRPPRAKVTVRCTTDHLVSLTFSIMDHLVAQLCTTKARHAIAPAAV